MKNSKVDVISTGSTMSNLVGMWAVVWTDDIAQERIKCTVFIYGKADEKYFLVQAINSINGEPNIAHLRTIEQMKYWTFLPTEQHVTLLKNDIARHAMNRYKVDF